MPETHLSSLEIREAFRQPLPPIEITWDYRARLSGVLLGLVVLQILYLLLIGGVATFTWLYAIAALNSGASLNVVTIAVFVGPPIAGVVVSIFLLKPLIIRPPRTPEPLQLLRDKEPVLFEFVDRLCRALGSPRPSRIFVNLRVNASASVRGWRGFFLGHMDLTIGLPLAVGLTLPQFTGVLAHEFGHFAQRTGLRSHFLIQTIQGWFARVVHQRDKMDAWLDRQRGRRDWRIKAVAHLAGFAVHGSRKYLALLMKAGAWISTAFSRQMEFDADRQEAAMVGVEVFEQTSRQIPLLAVGANLAWQDVAHDWSVGALPEDVAHLAVTRTNFLSEETSQQILAAETSQKTGRWDTHPSMSERIASARAAGFAGAFHLQGSTQRLFRDLTDLCREATAHHYKTIMEVKNDAVRLVPVQEAIANARAEREYENAVRTLFNTTPQFCARWFRLPTGEPQLLETSGTESGETPSFDASAYDAALHTNLLHFAALIVRRSGIAVNPKSFQLAAGDFETIQRTESISTRNMDLALEEYRRSSAHIARRIESTMAQLLNHDLAVAISPDRCTDIPDLRSAWKCYGALSQFQGEVMEVRMYGFAVQIVRENARLFPAALCANLIDDLETQALSEIDKILSKTGNIPTTVQFDSASPMTVSGQLVAHAKSRPERIQLFLSRIEVVLARTLGQLAWLTLAACRVPDSNPSVETAS
jgi:Zn-dependent protease with chaperone function